MTTDTIPADLAAYLADLAEADIDAKTAHLEYLSTHEDEADRDQQRAECERALELATKALAYLTA